MPFKACLTCELLFEVDAKGMERCTQCASMLVDYEPEPWELEQLDAEQEQGETVMLAAEEVQAATSSGVVATMAIEGLAERLRKAAADKVDPSNLLPPKPAERPAPKPVEVPKPVQVPKPVEAARPVEVPKPVEAEIPRTLAIEPHPIEPRPVEAARPLEVPRALAAEARPVEARPVEARPAEARPAQPRPVETPRTSDVPRSPFAPRPVEAAKPVPVAPSPRAVDPVKPVPVAPSPKAVEPVRAAPISAPQPRADDSGKGRATKMLDVSGMKPGEWPDMAEPPRADVARPDVARPDVARPDVARPDVARPDVALRTPTPAPLPRVAPATPMSTSGISPIRKKKKSKAGLLVLVVVILGAAGGGLAAWYFTQQKKTAPDVAPEAPPTAPATVAEAPRSFPERMAAEVKAAGVRLPEVPGAPALEEGPSLVGGPEGLFFSEAPVAGLASARIEEAVVGSENGREFVLPLRAAFDRGAMKDKSLILALDRELVARDTLRVAWSALLAGSTRITLATRSGEATGGVTFTLVEQPGPLSAEGRVEVRIGRLGLLVNVRDAQDQVISQGEARIDLLPDGGLALDAFTTRLDALVAAHASVREAVVHPSPEMTHAELALVIGRLQRTADGARFPDVRVVAP